MQYHFDSEIRLLQETERQPLFPWFLQEFSKEGKALSSKLVPWKWSLDFRATELKYIRGFESANAEFSQAGEHIRALLKAEPDYSSSHVPRYTMFGTNRVIQDFSVTIHKLQDEQAEEKCTVWGSVSFTHDTDFGSHTEKDLLAFRINLKPGNYDALCYFAKHGGNQDELLLSIKGVPGFYSEWSPLISTNSIKVLAADTEQNVIQLEGSNDPPRLGEITKFTLKFTRRTIFATSTAETALVVKDNSVPLPAPADANAALFPVVQQLQTIHKSLRIPIWIIAVLLVLLLLR